MDGLDFRMSGDPLRNFFKVDRYGSLIPELSKLPLEEVANQFRKQLNSKTGFYERLASIYERADVQSTDNPHGNTPVIGVGYKLFGDRPLKIKSGERMRRLEGRSQKVTDALERRERKIEQNQLSIDALHESLKPIESAKRDYLLWLVDGDQKHTGGGFDGNMVGEVHKSALHFITDSSTKIDYEDSDLSKVVVEACLMVRDELVADGMSFGSLKPVGASYVRAMQDNDGMFGYPVYASGYDELSRDLSKRLLIECGVDCSHLVGTTVYDKTLKRERPFGVVDAGGYILDTKVFTPSDLISIVTLLVRIQKHGWKIEEKVLVPKDGKTRSVYPNSFIQAVIEGMCIQSFNEECKTRKVRMLTSLQDKPTRVEMVKHQIKQALRDGYDFLAADWSKWDASIKGAILATILNLVVKPFFDAKYHYWIDSIAVILTYKVLILDTNLCALNSKEFEESKRITVNTTVKNYSLFGLVDGLISGAKFTHTGGSLYGEVVIHHAIPLRLGFKPIVGQQAGDDTLVGVPISRIDTSSVDKTYGPIIEEAERFGLHANVSKQIWHQVDGEIVKVFLQDSYHSATDIWGIGSIFRPYSAVWFSERDKKLSVPEQLMAEIARMEQGADNPFAPKVVEHWLSEERYLGWLFKTKGVSGFRELIEVIGEDIISIAQRIDVGSFSFGISRDNLQAGNLRILNIMADVTDQMSFSSEDRADFLEDYNPTSNENQDDIEAFDLYSG